jgi:hypothetical protein
MDSSAGRGAGRVATVTTVGPVWASLGPDAMLRTVVVEGPADGFALFGRLMAKIVFQPLD